MRAMLYLSIRCLVPCIFLALLLMAIFGSIGLANAQAVPVFPSLSSVGPNVLTQGASQARLTLVGTNFSPGARVVVGSSPTSALSDVIVQSTVTVNTGMILAMVSVLPNATPGTRTIDVINPDSGSTVSTGTTRAITITPGSSLAASLQVENIALMSPRDGTVVSQGDDVFGQAVIAGAGTGVVTGQWLWDGNVSEQFTAQLVGGQRSLVKTTRSLPTFDLGTHTLTVVITSPNRMQTKTILVAVNPGNWRAMRLVAPGSQAGFALDAPPLLRWTIMPGAAGYQVGFTTKPFFSAINRWYDVSTNEWQVPEKIWKSLPDGDFYWTVRVTQLTGDHSRPAPLRAIKKMRSDVLSAIATSPRTAPSGAPLLEWKSLEKAYYRVTVSRDSGGRNVLRRYLTPKPSVDLRMVGPMLEPGKTYYWQVEAFTTDGRRLDTGPWQSFVAGIIPTAHIEPRLQPYLVASLAMTDPPTTLDSFITKRQPAPSETVSVSQPDFLIEFLEVPTLDAFAMAIDDTDVTAFAQFDQNQLKFRPFLPLANGAHKVTLNLSKQTTEWSFIVNAQQATVATPESTPEFISSPVQPGTDAEPVTTATGSAPPAQIGGTNETPKPDTAQKTEAKKEAGRVPPVIQSNMQIGMDTQWISGSEADTNQVTIAQQYSYKAGGWTSNVNGAGLLSSNLGPEPRHAIGHFNQYVAQLGYESKSWALNTQFGILAPTMFVGNEFLTTGTAREGFEPTLRTKAGTFGYYINTFGNGIGAGAGIGFDQKIMTASYEAPLPKDKATFRLLWLSASDRGAPSTISFDPWGNPIVTPNPIANPASGDGYGAYFQYKIAGDWALNSEYAWSYNNANTSDPTSTSMFGRAWKAGVQGTVEKALVVFTYRDVGPNFATPANPGLTMYSNPDRRGVDSNVSRPTKLGTFTFGYQYLQNGVHATVRPELVLHNFTGAWSKSVLQNTAVSVQFHEARTMTGTIPDDVLKLPIDQQLAMMADTRDVGFNTGVSHAVGQVSLSLSAGRDFFHNKLMKGQNIITTNTNVGANWNARTYFRLQSNFGVNWVAGEKFTVGVARVLTLNVQPMFIWDRAKITITPLIAFNQAKTELGTGIYSADQSISQYSARFGWQMPGVFKFSTLSLEGGKTQVRNALTGTLDDDPRFLVLWNIVWGHSR